MRDEMMNKLTCIVLIILGLSSCDFFGEKTSTDFIDIPVYENNIVSYIPVQPAFTGSLVRPVDVIAGYDNLIYVVDEATERIVSFDMAGKELGAIEVPGVTEIAMDRRLNLLAIGTYDTTISNSAYTLSTVYRIEMPSDDYGLSNGRITNRIVHPFYFKGSFSPSDAQVRFAGVATLADNKFYLTRNGDDNNTLKFGGPDDAVLLFSSSDDYQTNVIVNTSSGFFQDYFKEPGAIVTEAQPPQNPFVSESEDFMCLQKAEEQAIKYRMIHKNESDFGTSYDAVTIQEPDSSVADNYIMAPNRFSAPSDLAYAGDGRGYVFVSDSEKDSVFVFLNGWEGVEPPPASLSAKYVNVSFGGNGVGPMQFDEPMGVAYLYQTLYVADANNGRVSRFTLSSDYDD